MKGVVASLFVFLMMFSFAVAGSSSSIRTDFYIQESGVVGGSEEDVTDTNSLQMVWLSKIIYGFMIIIAFAIFVKLFKILIKPLKVTGGKKSRSKKSKSKKFIKKSRRKK